eukprot:sb/3473641/
MRSYPGYTEMGILTESLQSLGVTPSPTLWSDDNQISASELTFCADSSAKITHSELRPLERRREFAVPLYVYTMVGAVFGPEVSGVGVGGVIGDYFESRLGVEECGLRSSGTRNKGKYEEYGLVGSRLGRAETIGLVGSSLDKVAVVSV